MKIHKNNFLTPLRREEMAFARRSWCAGSGATGRRGAKACSTAHRTHIGCISQLIQRLSRRKTHHRLGYQQSPWVGCSARSTCPGFRTPYKL